MTRSRQIQPIPVVARFFRDPQATPIIEQVFYPDRGWRTTGYRKRVSRAWLRKIRREDGVTHVALRHSSLPFAADFSIRELLAS